MRKVIGMCSAVEKFGFAESSSTSAEPSQLLRSCSVFYISTLAIRTAEYSALSIVDEQGRAAHEYKSKTCFVFSREPEKTEANTNAACLVKLIFVEIHGGRSKPFCLRPLLDYAVEYFPCVLKIYIKSTVYTITWLRIASCLQLCAVLQLFISKWVTIGRILHNCVTLCYKWPKSFLFFLLNPYLSQAWIHKAKNAISSLYFSLLIYVETGLGQI